MKHWRTLKVNLFVITKHVDWPIKNFIEAIKVNIGK